MDTSTQQLIEKAKLLVVGAGGIGCELLKNLILTGFTQIEVVRVERQQQLFDYSLIHYL